MIRGAALGPFATSLNFLVGYGGMVSFGHGMFFGLGAYTFALLMQRTGMPIPAAFALTLVMCAVLGLIVGAICVRLKEVFRLPHAKPVWTDLIKIKPRASATNEP